MFLIQKVKIRNYEIGLHFHNGEFQGLLGEEKHRLFDLLGKVRVDVVSRRDPWLVLEKLDVIVKSGALKDRTAVQDLKHYQRALVWIDGRFSHLPPQGLFAYHPHCTMPAGDVLRSAKHVPSSIMSRKLRFSQIKRRGGAVSVYGILEILRKVLGCSVSFRTRACRAAVEIFCTLPVRKIAKQPCRSPIQSRNKRTEFEAEKTLIIHPTVDAREGARG